MGRTLGVAAVGTSGWSYPTWRPGFYPAGAHTEAFLALYAERLPAVELNATGYRLPSADQLVRWAAQVPDGFRFAVKAPGLVLRRPEVVLERVCALGDRLGCVRVVLGVPRDDTLLARLLDAAGGVRLALDVRHPSWDGTGAVLAGAGAVLVGDDRPAAWRYLRFREPPWDEAALTGIAASIRAGLDEGIDTFAFFRHEDEPRAPLAALRLLELLAA